MGLFKDFAKNFGGIAKDSVLAGVTQGIRQTQLSNNLPNRSFSSILGNDIDGYFSIDNSISSNNTNEFSLFGIETPFIISKEDAMSDKYETKFPHTEQTPLIQNIDYKKLYAVRSEDNKSDIYNLTLPKWGYDDFINERNIFIKHLSNGFDEPGWFYFKIFFDFSSNHGLFGGIMSSSKDEKSFISVNSATDYLLQCKNLFKYEKLQDRITCLQRFTRLLSYININSPWFFKSIKNLSQISKLNFENLSEEKSIEIELNQDAIDMRISTLLSLYKYACYDDINLKEILPENLRKFDMCILVFSAPIKFIHNIYNSKSNQPFKSIYSNENKTNPTSIMSFKLYKLLNCEIDIDSIGGYMNNDINNEQPFALGQNILKIKYDRAYEYLMNEYTGLMFGSDGIYLDNPNITVNSINDLTVLSESKIHSNINTLLKGNSRFVLGNIFNQEKQIYKKNIEDNIISKQFTDYAKTKFGMMNNNKNIIINLGYDILYKLLGTGYNANAEVLKVGKQVIGDGTVLNGHGDYKVGSMVWRAKIRRLVNGNTNLSDREIRLLTVGKAKHTNWTQELYNKALNAV